MSVQIRRLTANGAALATQAMARIKVTSADGRDRLSPEHLSRFLEHSRNVLIVATDDDHPVGFVLAYLLDRPDRAEGMIFFYEIEVAATHRRRGIARAMVDLLKTIAAEARVFKMWVHTNRSNHAACGLYRASGGVAAGAGDEVSFRYDFGPGHT